MNDDVRRIGRNVSEDDLQPGTQVLVIFNIDNSGSMIDHKQPVIDSLAVCKQTLEGSTDPIQVSYITFGKNVEVKSFQYVEDVDYSYDPTEDRTRFYDAASVAAMDMYDRIKEMNNSYGGKGGIIMLTDGHDNSSKPESRQMAIQGLKNIKEKFNVPVIVGMLGKAEKFPELMAFCKECGAVPVALDDHHKLRRLMNLFSSSMSTGNLTAITDTKTLEEYIEE